GEAGPVELGGVEIGGVIVRDLALVGAGARIGAAGALDDLGIAAVHDLADDLEGAEAGPVRRDLRRRAPGAIGVEIEIVAWRDVAVDAGQVDAERMTRARGGGRGVTRGR